MYRTLYGQPPETVDEQRGKPRPEIDVAFIGESIVEAMDGRWLGKKIVRAVSRNSEGEDHKRPDIGKVISDLIDRPEHFRKLTSDSSFLFSGFREAIQQGKRWPSRGRGTWNCRRQRKGLIHALYYE